jgi:D-alanyl-lipoteichoic acid acyltransferase DltB (MBOAT superfamily)
VGAAGYDQIREQLTRVATARNLRPNLREGIKYFSYGSFAKVFFADMLANFHRAFELASNASSLDAAFSILAYSFRVFYDF